MDIDGCTLRLTVSHVYARSLFGSWSLLERSFAGIPTKAWMDGGALAWMRQPWMSWHLMAAPTGQQSPTRAAGGSTCKRCRCWETSDALTDGAESTWLR